MKKITSLFLSVLFLLFCFAACDKDDSNNQTQIQPFTVMSYNIRTVTVTSDENDKWENRKEALFAHIKSYSPDIIGMQEVSAFQFQQVVNALSDEYLYVSYFRDGYDGEKEGTYGEANTIFFKTSRFELISQGNFWLSETPDVVSQYTDAACRRICTHVVLKDLINNKELAFYNTHLDHIGDEARRYGASVIVDKMKEETLPKILTGDFNCNAESTAYETLTTVLDDARVLDGTELYMGTYHNYGNIETVGSLPIDMCFITPDAFAVNSYKVLAEKYNGVYTSDHYAILISLTQN